MPEAFLVILAPDGSQRKIAVRDSVTIGRHPDNVIVLTDVQTSRFHCLIARDADGYMTVADQGSRNGTLVNGEAIAGVTPLRGGDVVSIGTAQFRIAYEEPKPSRPLTLRPVVKRTGATSAVLPARSSDDSEIVEIMAEAEIGTGLMSTSERVAQAGPEAAPEPAEPAQGEQYIDERALPAVAAKLGNDPFPAEQIALLNSTGQVVHTAMSPEETRRAPGNAPDAIGVLRHAILIACRSRAAEIHLEPRAESYALRLRLDGSMVELPTLSKGIGSRLGSLVKLLSGVEMHAATSIQEGRFYAQVPGRRIEYAASFSPVMLGQKLSLRIFDAVAVPMRLADLQMPAEVLEQASRAIRGDGMMVVAGPAASGKTTTLYAMVRDIVADHRSVVTIEDPIELAVDGASQVPVNQSRGEAAAGLLRSMLRQNPDAIMLWQMRQGDAAGLALQAAAEGHLLLTSISARDAAGALLRLVELGAEARLVASSVRLVLAQRLIRQLCPHCRKVVPASGAAVPAGVRLEHVAAHVGCARCLYTGYMGRRAIYEMLIVDEPLREAIASAPSAKAVETVLAGAKYERFAQAAWQLVAYQVTSVEEVLRVVG